MSHIIIALFILSPLLSFSQRTEVEEKAMEYYIKNIHEKGDKLKSSGKVEIKKEGNYIGYVMGEYLVCKRHATDSAETRFFYNEYMKLGTNAIGKLDTVNLMDIRVKLGEPIRKEEKLKFQKLRGGPIGLWRRTTNKLFGEPFNVYFFRHIEFEGYYYTMIEIIKKDGEYSRQLWFKLTKGGEILDWCEGGWIQ